MESLTAQLPGQAPKARVVTTRMQISAFIF